MSDRSIRIVLDTSAIVAFTRGSIDVGEVIAEVDDEQAAVGLPDLCLVEASRAVADASWLDLLVNRDSTRVLADQVESWRAFAATYEIVGRLDAASAVLAAIDLDCHVLTGQPGLYGGLAGGGPVIGI
jgi:predicted nucleic acid-binding protein